MRFTHRALFALILTLPAPRIASAEPVPAQVYRDKGTAVFTFNVPRPEQLAPLTFEAGHSFSRSSSWPRLVEVWSDPPWKYATYMEDVTRLTDENRWSGIPPVERLSFIVQGPVAGRVSLRMRYPVEHNTWREQTLEIDLDGASALPTDPDPRQRWAAAQAATFALYTDASTDPGGFFSFATKQTAWKYGIPPEKAPPQSFRQFGPPEERWYEITTGALAVQESLQLDRMTNTDRKDEPATIEIGKVFGVEVKSHPFDKMRGEKEPRDTGLAALIPEDNWYARFSSAGKLLDFVEFVEQWGGSLLRLAEADAADQEIVDRVLKQLGLSRDLLRKVAAEGAAGEVGLTGSDPYLEMGSDVALLLEVKNAKRFESLMPKPAAMETRGAQQIAIYVNSPAALKRLDSKESSIKRLADAPDYKYMRAAVFPLDPAQEDGFVYLSDPFIRRLVGPEMRIKQKRRLEALTSLRLITNAAMFHAYEHGPGDTKLADLFQDRALDQKTLFDPQGGTFEWDAAKNMATSTFWGSADFMKPLIEVPLERVTVSERDQYKAFRDRYEEYWRTYFDPIGVRLKIDKTVRAQMQILPLINNTTYQEMKDVSGGEPVTIDLDRIPPQTLLRFTVKLAEGRRRAEFEHMLGGLTNAETDWIGDWASFWIEDSKSLAALARRAYDEEESEEDASAPRRHGDRELMDFFNATFVAGIHVKNKISLAAFLVGLRAMIDTSAPNTVEYHTLEPYEGVTIVQLAPKPGGELAGMIGEPDEAAPQASQPAERGPALYYAIIGDGFYVSTQAGALRELIDAQKAPPREGGANRKRRANGLLYAAPGGEALRSAVSYIFERQVRRATVQNLREVWLLGRCGLLEKQSIDDAARRFLGYKFAHPARDEYTFSAEKLDATSSVYGSRLSPKRLDAPPPGARIGELLDSLRCVTAALRFTEDGLETTVEIERK